MSSEPIDYKDLYEQTCLQMDVLNDAYLRAIEGPVNELYGFFHTSCIYESAAALVSLHRTKRSAVRAMIAHQYAAWEVAQRAGRILTRADVARAKAESGRSKWTRKNKHWRKAYLYCKSHVAPITIVQ